jgi:hypothetical protein
VTAAEQLSFPLPVAGLTPISLAWANTLLARWGHYLGPCERPFGAQAWALEVESRAVAVAVSASTVSEHIAWTDVRTEGDGDEQMVIVEKRTMKRGEIVELARLCAAPGERWATQPMCRLWREVGAQRWPYWSVKAAVAYSQNSRHRGGIYRFDGWERVSENCGSSGGGAWSRKRYATDAAHGQKSLWLWRYPVAGGDAA